MSDKIKEFAIFYRDDSINLEIHEGHLEWETGKRIWEAKDLIEEDFILMYSDNFASCDLKKAVQIRKASQTTACLLIQPKEEGNIQLESNSRIKNYDNSRSKNYKFVEIGYMSVSKRKLLERMDPEKCLSVTLESLSKESELTYIKGDGLYHSISDINRLKLMEEHLKPKRIIMIDRDGTINERAAKGEYINDIENFVWINDTIDAMKELSSKGYRFIVISNQAGIARGMLSETTLNTLNTYMIKVLKEHGIEVIDTFYCTHGWNEGCDCRKPKPGMLIQARQKHNFRIDQSIFVGDDDRDMEAAKAAGCIGVQLVNNEITEKNSLADHRVEQLSMAVQYIDQTYSSWEALLNSDK